MTDNPHDALFQYVFSNPEHAGPALRTMLPPALARKVDFATLTLSPGHFVDPELDAHRSDLLFSARIANRDAFIYVLWEHQSYVDAWLLLRLLEYMVQIWQSYRDEHPRSKKLPVIVPVVLHHSKTGWRAARRFEEIVDVDAAASEVLAYVPRFGVRKVGGDSVFDQIFYAGERLELKGFERGIEQSKREGRRDVLVRQLALRFGELPASALETLDVASIEALDRMTDRILTAATLAEVLGTEPPAAPKPARKAPARRASQPRSRKR
ncbi:Rpn family recombination-promoting nuclease/putative transposase [Polyangium sorediatum]|uniref:Rpn family recombination-promoting nuclease/putative transposase n=1 Tax=Polyangium sorediatum TaxID=889274 RepID=A0ABT6NI52_9BACT|nr:Rpn family recombination-promoting nuclease/putative transposase [Polyangium sorediatum]MDI1427983.1 Rpn family recombination-promoting nuclease/putative transposase [Polyangium sorediatum]